MIRLVLSAVLTLLFCINSYADVEFEMTQKEFNPESQNKSDGMVKGKNFKMDIYDNGVLQGTMIYRGDTKEMLMVSHDDKTYIVLDKEKLSSIAQKMNAAMAEMEAALQSMPPEQREQMKKMMQSKVPGMGEEYVEPVIKEAGASKAGQYSCTLYDVYRGAERVRQHCVAKWSEIEGGEEMKTVMTEMASFMDEMAESFSGSAGFMGSQIQTEQYIFNKLKELNGFPVQTRDFNGDEVVSESMLTSTKEVTVSEGEFEPPAGYKAQTMDLR